MNESIIVQIDNQTIEIVEVAMQGLPSPTNESGVRGTRLTGLIAGAAGAVLAATDTILTAFGKVQGQISNLAAALADKVEIADGSGTEFVLPMFDGNGDLIDSAFEDKGDAMELAINLKLIQLLNSPFTLVNSENVETNGFTDRYFNYALVVVPFIGSKETFFSSSDDYGEQIYSDENNPTAGSYEWTESLGADGYKIYRVQIDVNSGERRFYYLATQTDTTFYDNNTIAGIERDITVEPFAEDFLGGRLNVPNIITDALTANGASINSLATKEITLSGNFSQTYPVGSISANPVDNATGFDKNANFRFIYFVVPIRNGAMGAQSNSAIVVKQTPPYASNYRNNLSWSVGGDYDSVSLYRYLVTNSATGEFRLLGNFPKTQNSYVDADVAVGTLLPVNDFSNETYTGFRNRLPHLDLSTIILPKNYLDISSGIGSVTGVRIFRGNNQKIYTVVLDNQVTINAPHPTIPDLNIVSRFSNGGGVNPTLEGNTASAISAAMNRLMRLKELDVEKFGVSRFGEVLIQGVQVVGTRKAALNKLPANADLATVNAKVNAIIDVLGGTAGHGLTGD